MSRTMSRDVDVGTQDFAIRAGEKVQIEESNKYSLQQSAQLWAASDLAATAKYGNTADDYRKSRDSALSCIFILHI